MTQVLKRNALASTAKAFVKAVPTVTFTKIDTATVSGILAPLRQPLVDLDNLIADRESHIDNLFIENERLRNAIAINLDKIALHEAEIEKARDATTKLRAFIA